jgi:hypothetical protein
MPTDEPWIRDDERRDDNIPFEADVMEYFEADNWGEPEKNGCEENDGEDIESGSDDSDECDEPSLEPDRHPNVLMSNSNDIGVGDDETHPANRLRGGAEAELNNKPHSVKFSGGKAGAVYTDQDSVDGNAAYTSQINNADNPFSPFSSRIDWEIAHWAKTHGPSSTAFTELMSIEGVSYSTHSHELGFDL